MSELAISTLVEQILVAKRDDPNADVSTLEAEVDQLVYSLYGLTREEIAIIEESLQEKRVNREVADEAPAEDSR